MFSLGPIQTAVSVGREGKEIGMCGAPADLFVYKTLRDKHSVCTEEISEEPTHCSRAFLGTSSTGHCALCALSRLQVACVFMLSSAEGEKRGVVTERVSRKEGSQF